MDSAGYEWRQSYERLSHLLHYGHSEQSCLDGLRLLVIPDRPSDLDKQTSNLRSLKETDSFPSFFLRYQWLE